MNFKIPKSFSLLGHEYTVEIVDDLYEKEDRYGDADPDAKKIRIQSVREVERIFEEDGNNIKSKLNITEEDQIETFFHELMHIVLHSMGQHRLYKNETFVSLIGKCLLEIEKTKKYE